MMAPTAAEVRRLGALAFAMALASSCSCYSVSSPKALPEVVAITPSRVPSTAATPAIISGRNFFGLTKDRASSGEPPQLDLQFAVRLGAIDLAPQDVVFNDTQTLSVVVPQGLAAGTHDVTVTTPGGDVAILPGGLTVVGPHLAIEDAPGGGGKPIGSLTRSLDEPPLTVYAIARDAEDRFVGPQRAAWSLTSPIGTLAPSADGASAIFTAQKTGLTRISAVAADASFGTGQTGELTITPGAPVALGFVTAPQSLPVGQCSAAAGLQALDARGDPTPEPSGLTISIAVSPAGGLQLYADSACATPASTVAIAAGASRGDFYFRGTTPGSFDLTATATGRSSASQREVVSPRVPVQLAFTSAPMTVAVGGCSSALGLEVQDAAGAAVAMSAPAQLALAASVPGALAFFSDSGCVTSVAAVTVGAGGSAAGFFFKGLAVGTPSIAVSAPGLTGATQLQTVTAGPPAALVFTTPAQTRAAGACSAVATVRSEDALGNPSSSGAAVGVTLAASPSAGFTFFSDPACALPVTAISIAASASTADLYFRGTAAGGVTVGATASGLTPASQLETITAGAAAALVVAGFPSPTVAGAPGTFTVTAVDPFGNTDRGFGGTVSVTASDGQATLPGPAVFAPGDQGVKTLSATLRTAGTQTLSATDGLGASGSQAGIVVDPAALSALAVAGFPSPTVAGAAGGFTVTARDSFGNTVTSYTGTAAFTSTDPLAVLPPAATFTGTDNGVKALSATLRTAGVQSLTAADGAISGTQPNITVEPGAAAVFAWSPVSSPQTQSIDFAVTVSARDAFGNPAPAFTGTASLSAGPAGALVSCSTSCSSSTTTAAFVAGAWTGSVAVTPGGLARQLTATSAAITGTSNLFDVIGPPGRSPPTAKFSVSPSVVVLGQSMSFDASGSSDLQTAASGLLVSWDFTGAAAGNPPWTAWTAAKTASFTYSAVGTYAVRLAVQDGDGDIGYGYGTVVVVASVADICSVGTNSINDDGAVDCTGGSGADGQLSFREAIRLSNSMAGTQTVTFSAPMTLSGGLPLSITNSVTVAAVPGVVLEDYTLSVPGGSSLIAGLELRGGSLSVQGAGTLQLVDVVVNGQGNVDVLGTLTAIRLRAINCTGNCIHVNGPVASLTVTGSEFLDAGANAGIFAERCTSSGVDVQSSVFARLGLGVRVDGFCNGARVVHNTFDQNGYGVSFATGTGHVLRNNLFTRNTLGAISSCAAAFASRDHHLLFNTAAVGCLGADPNGLTSDPQYVLPSLDFRLHLGSPAVDAAVNLGLDLNGVAPGLVFGAGPDRGGRETW